MSDTSPSAMLKNCKLPHFLQDNFTFNFRLKNFNSVSKLNHQKGILSIGTSNIVVPGSKQSFPPEFREKSRLSYYSSLFNTLEVNSTFYKLPMPSTLKRWSGEVPANFRFSIKLWKEITHAKQLEASLENINTFLSITGHIGNTKGCLLVQFPAGITAAYFSKVEDILRRFHQCDSENQWHKAIEFRSDTWYSNETYTLLREYSAVMVLHDMPKSRILVHVETDKFYYFRFHGPTGDYRGSYSDAFLHEQATKIKSLLTNGKDVYAYFNNTMGDAFANAMRLREMSEE